jgi:hypothetical protein
MGMNVVDGTRIVAGSEYIAAGADLLDPAVNLTIPENARVAIIQAGTDDLRWTDDGSTDPSATVGMLLAAGDSFLYVGELIKVKLFSADGGVNIHYYK